MVDKKKDAYYFSHDTNARNDEKMMELRAEYDLNGIGMFWCLIEMMAESPSYELSLSRLGGIAMSLSVTKEELTGFIKSCSTEPIMLFQWNEEAVWSESLKRRMNIKEEKRRQKVEAGKKGAQSRWNPETDDTAIAENGKGKETETETETNGNLKGNGNENGPCSAVKNSSTDKTSNSVSSSILTEDLSLTPTDHQKDIIKSRFFLNFNIDLSDQDIKQFCNSNIDLKEEFIRSTNKSWFENLLLAIRRMKVRSEEKPIKDPVLYFSKGITRKDSEPFLLLPDKFEEDNYTTYSVSP